MPKSSEGQIIRMKKPLSANICYYKVNFSFDLQQPFFTACIELFIITASLSLQPFPDSF